MIGPKAGRRMQMHSADGALIGRLPPLSSSTAAVDAVASLVHQLGPMSNKALVYNSRGSQLYGSAVGGVGSCYLHQELLAEGQHARLSVVLQTPQLVGVENAHIE